MPLPLPPALAAWLVGAAVLLGVVLARSWLVGQPVLGAWRWVGWTHGALAAGGTALAVRTAPGTALALLAAAVAGGLAVLAAQLRGRKPPGLAVALHAAFGVAGAVLLVALGAG